MTRLSYGNTMRLVRRIHMYLGLLMYPWVLFFGVTGLLFNHPRLGREVVEHAVSAKEMSQNTEFTPWNADHAAKEVLKAINHDAERSYQLVGHARFSGFPILVSGKEDGGRNVLIMSLTTGQASVSEFDPTPKRTSAPFAGEVDVPSYTMKELANQTQGILEKLGIAGSALRPHPKVAPQLKMTLTDGQTTWNGVYDLGTGKVEGRPAEATTHTAFVELLGNMHKQHHYPVDLGIESGWALFADLTGLCLILWGISGLAMSWQIRAARRWGLIVVGVSLLLSMAAMLGMAIELQFMPGLAGGP